MTNSPRRICARERRGIQSPFLSAPRLLLRVLRLPLLLLAKRRAASAAYAASAFGAAATRYEYASAQFERLKYLFLDRPSRSVARRIAPRPRLVHVLLRPFVCLLQAWLLRCPRLKHQSN